MLLSNLADVARTSGLRVVEIPGWQLRGRPPSTGEFGPLKGLLCHHTGDDADTRAYAEWLALTGRPDLPAPLAHLGLDRAGTVYVLAAGRANHAGACRARGGWLKAGDGNAQLLGIEAFNTGSEGWSLTQYGAYVRLAAALCRGYGWPASHVLGHKETSTTGKWDPGGIDMPKFRREVGTAMTNPQQEDDMPSADEIAKAVWQYHIGRGEREAAAAAHLVGARAASRAVLSSFAGMAEEISAAVVAELPALPEADDKRLRSIVYAQASRAINNRLGSLNE